MNDILANYPLPTLHEVAVEAARERDISTISYLLTQKSYLPIRWEDVYMRSSDILICDLITMHGRYKPPVRLVRPIPDINGVNYTMVLDKAIWDGDIDTVSTIISMYGKDILSPYKDAPIPHRLKKYLVENNYLIVPPRLYDIIMDLPIDSLSSSEVEEVIAYDSISIFRTNVKEIQPSSYLSVHGRILSYILRTDHDNPYLLSKASCDDLKNLTSTPSPPLYLEIAKRGYFELLYGMGDRDLLIVMTSPYYHGVVKEFITHEYKGKVFTPYDILEGAVYNKNKTLISKSPLPTSTVTKVIEEYWIWDPDVVTYLLPTT